MWYVDTSSLLGFYIIGIGICFPTTMVTSSSLSGNNPNLE